MTTSKKPLYFRAFVLAGILSVTSAAWSQSPIKDLMKEEIGPAFKVIFADLKAHTIGPKTQAASKTLLHGLTGVQNLAPEFVPDGSGGARATTLTEAAEFKEQSRQTLSFAVLLDRALTCGAGELPDVWKAFTNEMVKAKLEATPRPVPQDVDNVMAAAEIFKVLSAERKSAHDRYKSEQ